MDGDDGRWMTFAELAEARGTSKRAAVVLVRRHCWRRQRNNAGHVIALVPPAWTELTAGDNGEGHSERHDPEPVPFHARALAALEDALAALREGHTREVTDLRERLAETTARAEQAEARANQARAEAEEALHGVERLRQAEEARKARGRLARLRAAWKGD
jgi:hypothetical protein